ncbi:MAG: hypothetical protein K9J16_10665 [Melioribacteraceae bacterium]|nr:hypothetical protein [Melioribacteraceae bacterium]MCF8355180.1 hypothetical protein [Melioribacteraceae bacterium]MCF8395393.1 hypothetical protein [Melioribacteraceae bacterium]MCF8419901.1 hypothetical protein [Melioribacteraceae bacterium]
MKKYFRLSLLLSIILTLTISAQESLFQVGSFTIHDELTVQDPIDPDYGRYDAYEVYLSKGDRIAINLSAKEFWPFMFLVSPENETVFVYPDKEKRITTLDTVAFETGNFDLYVVGDTNSFGKYDCEINLASSRSQLIKEDVDLCTSIKYVLEHANADFYFLKDGLYNGEVEVWNSNVKITGSNENKISIMGRESFQSKFYHGDVKAEAENLFNELVSQIKDCLNDGWRETEKDWYESGNSNNYKEKFVKNYETGKIDFRFIKIIIREYDLSSKKYSVEIQIDKQRT